MIGIIKPYNFYYWHFLLRSLVSEIFAGPFHQAKAASSSFTVFSFGALLQFGSLLLPLTKKIDISAFRISLHLDKRNLMLTCFVSFQAQPVVYFETRGAAFVNLRAESKDMQKPIAEDIHELVSL